ncbi:hypothetical protein TWF970_004273 [Orbilia oligospora]|uniref:Uncharacterized protein n=1 Tax=Orbilia oligospora TaxID=2813651 RepID=A0A7C8R8Q1_ORBOL|nr:hypothetical protein TWF970_004273 [Orbilia oligospora]
MKWCRSLNTYGILTLLSFRALSTGLSINIVPAPGSCRNDIGSAAGCNPIAIEPDPTLSSLQKRDDDDLSNPDELDHYQTSLAQFDASCRRGVIRFQQYQERQESDGSDNPNPQVEVQSRYTVAWTASYSSCPSSIRRFYGLLAVEGPEEAMGPSYQEFKYASRDLSDVGASAVIRASVLENHVIVNWKGPKGGWMSRTKGYDEFEDEYHKLLFLSWTVMRSKAMVADGNKNLEDPNYQLFWVTIIKIQNPDTIRIFAEILRRRNLVFDDLFEIYAPEAADDIDFVVWTALLGTPEIGAVQEMLTGWAYQLKGFEIHAIHFGLEEVASSTELQAKVSVSIGPAAAQPNPDSSEATDIMFPVLAVLKDSSTTLRTYPGEVIFRESSSWVVRPEHIEITQNDENPASGKKGAKIFDNPSFKGLTFELFSEERFLIGKVEAYVSGPEQHLVIDSELPNISSQNTRDVLYQMWDTGIGSNSCLSYITFLRLAPKTMEVVREIFGMKKVNPTDGGVLTIWPSKKLWEEAHMSSLDQDEVWLDEKIDAKVIKELLPLTFEYSAVKSLLAHRIMWWQLGRPIIQNIKIGYQKRGSDSDDEGRFSILIQLADSIDRVGIGSITYEQQGCRATSQGFNNMGGVLRVNSKSAVNAIITMEGGYAGDGIEVTAEGREEIEALYSKGMRSIRDVANAIADDRMKAYNASILQELQRSNKIDFQSNGQPRKRLNPTESQILVRSYTRIAELPQRFVSVASDSHSQYDEVTAKVGSTNKRAMASYPYEILRSTPIGHLAVTRLPEENGAGEIPELPHILFLSWSLASKYIISRDADLDAAIQKDPLRYISILKLSTRSKNVIQETLNYYGITVNIDLNIRLSTRALLPSKKSLTTRLGQAGRLVGILGVVLGIPEVFAIQEMIRLYHGFLLLATSVIEEIYITWKDDNFQIFDRASVLCA